MMLNTIPREAWKTYRGVLAVALSDAAFDAVARACSDIDWAVNMNENLAMPLLGGTALTNIAGRCQLAQRELATIAYPDLPPTSAD